MATLRTDYQDDVFSGKRKYTEINNGDGTISFDDVTEYAQVGDSYGAAQINEQNDTINNLQEGMYHKNNPAMTDIADGDYFPIYDVSANAPKKTLWSNIKAKLDNLILPKAHGASSASTYGAATSSQFGHVKLSNSYTSNAGAADTSVGASSKAVYDAYTALDGKCDTLNNSKAKKNHADADATIYGMGTTSKYGHLKISNNYTSSAGAASDGVAASSKAVNDTYNNLNGKISDLTDGKAAKYHASTSEDFGIGSSSKYGHVKLTSTVSNSESAGIAVTPKAVQSVVDDYLTANSKKFIFAYDSTSKKYGYKLSGSSTFYPFSASAITWSDTIALGNMSEGHSYEYVTTRTFDTLFIYVYGHGGQPVDAAISAGDGTRVFSLTDYYGGGSASCFQNVKKGAEITLYGSGSEGNNINAILYGTSS